MLAFTIGALLPLLTIGAQPRRRAHLGDRWSPWSSHWPLTGWASARLGQSPAGRAVVRNVRGGVIAMVVTYAHRCAAWAPRSADRPGDGSARSAPVDARSTSSGLNR